MKILIAVMVLAFVAACTGTANVDHAVNLAPAAKSPTDGAYVPTPRPDDGAPRITLADAKKDFDAKSALFIDTRSAEQYAEGHVPGSINLSVSDLAAGKEDKLSKGKKIIAYCSWANEHTSASLVAELHKKGYTNSYALLGGTQAWVDAGYPMDKSK